MVADLTLARPPTCGQGPDMPLVFAALLLSAALTPPPDDDDDTPKSQRPARALPAPADDNEKSSAAAPSGSQPEGADEHDEAEGRSQAASPIVVTARRLDTARTQIDAALGSTVYSLTNDTVENRPGGETGSVSDILTQAPGVAQSSRGLTIRGSSANQVRINNVIIPEALSDPADQLSSRLAETTRLITGTLPAQYGFAPAGVISVTTKNGLYQHGGQRELFAGSDGMIEPALEWAGSVRATSLFASGDLEHQRSMVADEYGNTAHDRRSGISGLGFADHVIDENDRYSLIFGGSREHHAISATSIGRGSESNSDGYAVGTFQHSDAKFTVQASLFAGIESDKSRFNAFMHERRSSIGSQIDASQALGTSHNLRFGLLATHSTARELDLGAARSNAARTTVALYGQDEWKLSPSLTFNPGIRMEWLNGLSSGATIEPRASMVWEPGSGLTGHIGYSRFASAAPLGEEVTAERLPDEHDDYFDAGIQQKLGAFTLGADAYWRSARNYIAEHETVGSAVPIAFAFRHARINGVELSMTYAHRATTAWANASLARARAKDIIGGNGLFGAATIAAASVAYIPLATDRPVTLSTGLVQRLGKVSLSGDLLVSSGSVRTVDITQPNGSRHSGNALLGLAAVYHATIAGQPTDLRLDLTNLTNVRYATSDASAVEGDWTRYGRGRAITVGIEQGF
jgi:hypothetical protein